MRRWFSVVVMLLACCFAGQSVAAASAPYHECCMGGCEQTDACLAQNCTGCFLCAAVPTATVDEVAAIDCQVPMASHDQGVGDNLRGVWRPPD